MRKPLKKAVLEESPTFLKIHSFKWLKNRNLIVKIGTPVESTHKNQRIKFLIILQETYIDS